ncbi:hypothetical protein BDR05DRAFT_1002786 [Suillus weaverae]|nr:hypothetical protein BDR05DRAFT_1002786 [Suillus weaverae]
MSVSHAAETLASTSARALAALNLSTNNRNAMIKIVQLAISEGLGGFEINDNLKTHPQVKSAAIEFIEASLFIKKVAKDAGCEGSEESTSEESSEPDPDDSSISMIFTKASAANNPGALSDIEMQELLNDAEAGADADLCSAKDVTPNSDNEYKCPPAKKLADADLCSGKDVIHNSDDKYKCPPAKILEHARSAKVMSASHKGLVDM